MGSCLSAEGAAAADHPSAFAPLSSSSPTSPWASPSSSSMKNKRIDSKPEMRLHRVPGRFFLNASTDASSLFSKQGKKGINQDAMIVWENFGLKADTIFCGVFDGHGANGHMVAKKVRDSLPLRLKSQWELNSSSGMDMSNSVNGSVNSAGSSVKLLEAEATKQNQTDVFASLKESFLKAFKVMDKELQLHPYIDCFSSGTTAVTLVKQGQDLVIGNIGDSRAVLGTRDKGGVLIAVQLTEDHKPNLPREAERIRLCKGRVFALQSEPDVARVWLPNSFSPGLAMARAFGDFCLKNFGLISVPEISHYLVSKKDEFVVLATDGVWDVLSNEEVVGIVASATCSRAAQTLVDSAVRAWRTRFPTAKVDDCAVVCLFLNSTLDDNHTSCSTRSQEAGIDIIGTGKSCQ